MIFTTPSAEEQLYFLHKIQRLLDEGVFTSTYKYALLISLIDLAVEKGSNLGLPVEINSQEIAEKFILLYWHQVIPYTTPTTAGDVLFQNNNRQAAIINKVKESHSYTSGSLAKLKRNKKQYSQLVTSVARVVREMPLWKLQRISNNTVDDFLYENIETGGDIMLRQGVAYCLRQFYGQITSMVQHHWIQWIRKTGKNQPILGQSIDLGEFLFGSDRNSLVSYLPILRDLQSNKCFYCKREVKQGEVDHFIPWSRYPVDLGHNFVLAHKSCNGSKGDLLASIPHLESWVGRNNQYKSELQDYFNQNNLAHNLDSSISIARWAYAQADNTSSYLWHANKNLVTASNEWENMLKNNGTEPFN